MSPSAPGARGSARVAPLTIVPPAPEAGAGSRGLGTEVDS